MLQHQLQKGASDHCSLIWRVGHSDIAQYFAKLRSLLVGSPTADLHRVGGEGTETVLGVGRSLRFRVLPRPVQNGRMQRGSVGIIQSLVQRASAALSLQIRDATEQTAVLHAALVHAVPRVSQADAMDSIRLLLRSAPE